MDPQVILIGGAPGAGKTTLGLALAARLGISSLSADDLVTAAQAVTLPETHPGLHVMRRRPSVAYFTESSPAQLQADATQQHLAVWPMVEALVRQRAKAGPSIVIDGWFMRPSWVARLGLRRVWAGWLVAGAGVLEAREAALAWYQSSPDPARMRANFLARSRWYNEMIHAEATQHAMPVLLQPGERSVDDLCELVLAQVAAPPA